MNSKSKAIAKVSDKKIYTRHYSGGGLKGHQLIAGKHVFSLTKNSSGSNGPKHGWKVEHKSRKDTAL